MAAGRQGAELESREEIVAPQILVVIKDLLEGHPGREQLEQHRHRVAQAPDHGLTVADVRVRGDAVQAGHENTVGRNRCCRWCRRASGTGRRLAGRGWCPPCTS